MFMFRVALIGPDGCGKTTIARRLESSLTVPAKYVYMGVSLESSNLVLPTTWLLLRWKKLRGRRPDMAGPPDPTRKPRPPRGLLRRAAAKLKAALRLSNLVGEEWFRQRVISHYRRRGRVVLSDRDFFADYYAHDVAPPPAAEPSVNGSARPLSSRIHGYLLRRFYRRPDLAIFLDAPAELLYLRKAEGTVKLLERRRQEYLRLREVLPNFQTVDAARPLDEVAAEVRERILEFYRLREQAAPLSRRAKPQVISWEI